MTEYKHRKLNFIFNAVSSNIWSFLLYQEFNHPSPFAAIRCHSLDPLISPVAIVSQWSVYYYIICAYACLRKASDWHFWVTY